MAEAGRSVPAGSHGGSFSVLDGSALVAGAAVASVHIRHAISDAPMGPGWVVLWGVFVLITLTAAGPFLYFFRRFLRSMQGRPGAGDRLWGLLGTPWLATALVQAATTPRGADPPVPMLVAAGLPLGLGIASLVVLVEVFRTWVAVPAGEASRAFAGPWSNRVGLCLAVAWPVQWGLGMVVLG